MSFAVTVERRLHSEITTAQFTAEWFLSSMDTLVSNQITRFIEAFATHHTFAKMLRTAMSTSL